MLRVSLSELIAEVRIALDENAVQSAYLQSSADNLELDCIIEAKLPEAARDITETAEVSLLGPIAMPTEITRTDGGGILTIPDDFLRLVSLKMSGWNKAVTMVAGEGSDIELMQRNKYTRGTAMKPVAVFGRDSSGNKVIEYFGSGDTVECALYMPLPTVEGSGSNATLSISRLLKPDIIRRAAGLTLLVRGDTEQAQIYLG